MEDAGILDFRIATAGHGPLRQDSLIALTSSCVLTSDAAAAYSPGSSCYLACRSPHGGSLLWRRNVCSSPGDGNASFYIAYSRHDDRVYSVDSAARVRAWNGNDGSLLWELQLARNKLWNTLDVSRKNEVLVGAGASHVQAIQADSGQLLGEPQRHGSIAAEVARQQLAVTCGGRNIALDHTRKMLESSDGQALELGLTEEDSFRSMTLLECVDEDSQLFLVSNRGVSVFVSCSSSECRVQWTAHEGLSAVSQALFLDASHKLVHDQAHNLLDFSSRLTAQWKRITLLVSSLMATSSTDNHLFGFIQTAVLLSPTSHSIYGMETVGERRSKLVFMVDLPDDATVKHAMIHGAPNAPKAVHGIHGSVLTKHVLVVSHTNDWIQWKCMDGTTGQILTQENKISLPAPVRQMLPMTTMVSSACQQSVMLVLHDGSVLVAPNTASNKESIAGALSSTPNGFYTHTVDREQATAETFWVPNLNSKLVQTGSASFPGERIVRVAYPMRDEVVSSPSVALGDDSLLIKYINPHLMVVMTMEKDGVVIDTSRITAALEAVTTEVKGKQSRKPVGASAEEGSTTSGIKDGPNLFVNLVDTVSGRVLYRVSHSNSLDHPRPAAIVSENWVFYTYANAKTRRAEIGVLSLFEGMIGSKGLTAFTSPEQMTSLSSLDIREAKPVVLSKVYSLAKPATAIGVTKTHRGISSHRLVLATIDGQVQTIDRKSLEPRRPVGEIKDSEKKEGLAQYSEFVPFLSFLSLSYNQTIENVQTVITAPTDLESQSLILAFGGPDIFFARMSPSRGFDLLPESFSRALVSLLVAGLLVVLVVVRRRVASKIKSVGWL